LLLMSHLFPLLIVAWLPLCCLQSSNHVQRKMKERLRSHKKVEQHLADQFVVGRLLACISSRPGQCGRCDGYILEGKELDFYMRKMQKKKSKGAA
jgi:small subunit ribosomal protein S8e